MLQATDVSFRLRIALSIRRLLDWIGRSSLKTAHFAVAGTLFWRAEVQKHGEKLATTMPTRSDFKMTERSWPHYDEVRECHARSSGHDFRECRA